MVSRGAILAVVALASGACASHHTRPWEYRPRAMADTMPIREPAERQLSIAHEQITGSLGAMSRGLDLNRKVSGIPPALDADPFDGVVNSTWFVNRNQVDPLTPEEVFRGPQRSEGPDQSGPVKVWALKTSGITPGFWIIDAKGDRYILKFDPPSNLEMNSAAEVISSNLFWTAGYYVPENYVFFLDPSKLELDDDDDLEFKALEGDSLVEYDMVPDDADERQLTLEVFRRHFVDQRPRMPDGTIRVMASRFLSGRPKGGFAWDGTREDDPNDVVPHQHRRDLRGLYVLAAWLNHVDVKEGNMLDMFIARPSEDDDAPRIGYLRHHLQDLGSTLGSGSAHPHNPRHGTEYDLDTPAIGVRLVTFGLYRRPWQDMPLDPPTHPATGYYSIENFDPSDWRSNIIVPAFVNRTPRDGYWGAKIVMSFTDEQLEAAVRAGRYSDPAAAAYVLKGLKERRDATGRYWFAEVSPLDAPRIDGGALVFDDLWRRHFGGRVGYRWQFEWDQPDPDVETGGTINDARVPLPGPPSALPAGSDPEDTHARVKVWKVFDSGEEAPRPAEFWLAWDSGSRSWSVIGARY